MKKIVPYLFIFLALAVNAQNENFVSQTRFMQKVNPSYLGFNSLNRVGVLYNTLELGSNQTIDNKYFFGALSFDERNFSLGVDFNSFQIDKPGFQQNASNFHYIYKVQINNRLFFLPAVSLGIGSIKYNLTTLVFEDQLDQASGFVNSETTDPVGTTIQNVNYFDIGASFIIHDDNFLLGLSLKHLNRPNISYNQDLEESKPIQYTLNGAYEFGLNPYERSFLPRYSYLLAYASITQIHDSTYFYLSEEAQFGEFSIGVSQQISNVGSLNLNNVGLSVGLSLENFDFGVLYNFPIQNVAKVFSPSTFELYLTFDFSKFRRNSRGLFKRLQTDNYY
jgi:type IX secretion system PorP/SprF family membrane protein